MEEASLGVMRFMSLIFSHRAQGPARCQAFVFSSYLGNDSGVDLALEERLSDV